MTTVHAYTNDQNLLDLTAQGPAPGAGGARSTSCPRSTGAARATESGAGGDEGAARRDARCGCRCRPAPSPTSPPSCKGNPSVAEVNAAFAEAAAKPPLDRVLDYTEDPIVSSDIVGSPASCTFDAGLTMVMPINDELSLVKIVRLVRQRVGLLEPAGRPDRPGRRLTGWTPSRGIPLLGDLPDLDGKRVLVRVDFNVPLHIGVRGRATVADDFRITAALPTLRWLLDEGAEVVAALAPGPAGRRTRPPLGDGPGARAPARPVPRRRARPRTCASTRARRRTTRPSCSG